MDSKKIGKVIAKRRKEKSAKNKRNSISHTLIVAETEESL